MDLEVIILYTFIHKGKEIFNDFLENLEEDGFDVDYFMSKYINRALKDDDLVWHSGVMDMLLYKYDKSHPLSGELLSDSMNSWDEEGVLIKYYYGYHIVQLGKEYLYQTYDNLREYYKDCAEMFPMYFFNRFVSYKIKRNNKLSEIIHYYSDVIKHKDYFVSIVDLEGLCNNNYVYCSYSELLRDIDYNPRINTYNHIIDGCFIVYFGENIEQIGEEEVHKSKERMKIKESAEKYNL